VASVIPPVEGVGATMRQIAKTPFVHLAGILSCVYVGIEFTIGSWAVTFIIEERGGNSDSGYISTGFFGGLMIGRILHVFVTMVLSEQVAVLSYIIIALALQVVSRLYSSGIAWNWRELLYQVVWVISSVIANAVAYALIGLVLGPM
jgi:fucose permease